MEADFNKQLRLVEEKMHTIRENVEELRKSMSDLEKLEEGDVFNLKTTTPGRLISYSHHVILNSLLPALGTVEEGLRRANIEKHRK